jgi:hypothetical protein
MVVFHDQFVDEDMVWWSSMISLLMKIWYGGLP